MYSTVLLYCLITGTDLQNQPPKSPAYKFKDITIMGVCSGKVTVRIFHILNS